MQEIARCGILILIIIKKSRSLKPLPSISALRKFRREIFWISRAKIIELPALPVNLMAVLISSEKTVLLEYERKIFQSDGDNY